MGERKKYGRGVHQMNTNFIDYMHMIADHPHYSGLPGSINPNTGRVRWQTSNSPKTGLYEFYEERFQWWVDKADELGLPGEGKSDDRFVIAARLINPTQMRPCLFCGIEFNVGYLYLNKNLANRFRKAFGDDDFVKGQPIDEAMSLANFLSPSTVEDFILNLFPERKAAFQEFGVTARAFDKTVHIRSNWLTPGFMGNCPYRMDGLHDYANPCGHRSSKDTGRHDANMRTYNHDRRAFEWWAGGDWNLADALYNSAGPGACEICQNEVPKVSPDHVGPLACGFKHTPYFAPLCRSCNSSKNRFMTHDDIKKLIEIESSTEESMASFHIQPYWDREKYKVSNDREAHDLSNRLRTVEDYYLRCLHRLLEAGFARHLVGIVDHKHAFWSIEFEGLDSSSLTFDSYEKIPNHSAGRRSLAARSVRIGFDSLVEYVQKDVDVRRLTARSTSSITTRLDEIEQLARQRLGMTGEDRLWNRVALSSDDRNIRDFEIGNLLTSWQHPGDELLKIIQKSVDGFASTL